MADTDAGRHFATRSQPDKKSLTFFRESGRGKALVQINNFVKFNPGLILLMGDEGSGRSRLLAQFADGFREKTGIFCLINRSIKNDTHLHTALLDGFGIDAPSDNLALMQKAVLSFIESAVKESTPLVIALDDVQHCSLAMLEALVALQKKFSTTSLILVGDNTLQKMLERLLGGKVSVNPVVLPALDSRDIRQYLHWRLPFTLTDLEMTNVITLSRGNMALLEQEVKKREESYALRSNEAAVKAESGKSQGRWGMAIAVMVLVGAGYYFFTRPASSPAPVQEASSADVVLEAPAAPEAPRTSPASRADEECISRQETLLSHEQ